MIDLQGETFVWKRGGPDYSDWRTVQGMIKCGGSFIEPRWQNAPPSWPMTIHASTTVVDSRAVIGG